MESKELDLLEMGERIRKAREANHLSRKHLAELLDLSTKFIADIECGSKCLSLKKFAGLTEVLQVSADYLLFGHSSEPEPDFCCSLRIFIKPLESQDF